MEICISLLGGGKKGGEGRKGREGEGMKGERIQDRRQRRRRRGRDELYRRGGGGLTFACDRSTSAGRSHLFPTSSFIASGHPLEEEEGEGGGRGEVEGEGEGD